MTTSRTVRPSRVPALLMAAAVLAAAFFLSGPAAAAGLLEPAPAPEATAAAPAPPGTVRERYVRLDLDYLEANVAPRGIDSDPDRLGSAPAAGPLTLELFPDETVTLRRTRLGRAHGGGYVWSGRIPGDRYGFAVLVVSGDRLTGQVQHQGRVYRIAPMPGEGSTGAGSPAGLHRVLEIDTSGFPGDIVVPAPDIRGTGPAPFANPETRVQITVLVAYTHAAARLSGAIIQDANLAIALANTALANGAVNLRYRLVATRKVKGYQEQGFSADLGALRVGAGPFAPIHEARDLKGADLVAMLRKSGEYCGIGYYVASPSAASAAYGFTVSSLDCIPNHTVAHEIGHNSGLLHDRYVEPAAPDTQINFGYVNVAERVRTIMAYNDRCADNGFNCPRVPVFSTPKKTFEGAKLGIARGRKGAAHAVRRLNETRAGIAAYR